MPILNPEPDDYTKILTKLLYDQAKKCQTTSGAGLLLAIKGHLEGHQVYVDCDELWQAADVIGNLPPVPDAAEETDE